MNSTTLRRAGLTAAAAAALAVVCVPTAPAAPTAVPPSDSQGYVDSTARCTLPDTAVIFGTTKTSRVAICKTADGYQYRGVRISDGANLIAAATQTSGKTFTVSNDGIVYTVTPTALSVTANGDTFRTETWSDYHSVQSPAAASAPASAAPATPALATPAPASAAPATPGLAATPTAIPAAPTSTPVPLPPPMAAEAGGSPSASGE